MLYYEQMNELRKKRCCCVGWFLSDQGGWHTAKAMETKTGI